MVNSEFFTSFIVVVHYKQEESSVCNYSLFVLFLSANVFLQGIKFFMKPGTVILISNIWSTDQEKNAIKLDPLEYLVK
jgi:hypothetical protein